MDSFGIIILSLLVFIIGIVVQLFTVPRYKPIVALIFIAAISVLTSVVAVRVIWNIPEVISINLAGIFEELIIKVDSLSAWFILLINFTVLNGTLYGIGYLKSYENLKTNLYHPISNNWKVLEVNDINLPSFIFQNQEKFRKNLDDILEQRNILIKELQNFSFVKKIYPSGIHY